jgi:hypothetical protein
VTWFNNSHSECINIVESILSGVLPLVTSLSLHPYNTKHWIRIELLNVFNILHVNGTKAGKNSTFNGFQIMPSSCNEHSTTFPTLVLAPHCDAVKCKEYGKMVCFSCIREEPQGKQPQSSATVPCGHKITCRKHIHLQCGVITQCSMCINDIDSLSQVPHVNFCRCILCINRSNCGHCESKSKCIVCTAQRCKNHETWCNRCYQVCCDSHMKMLPVLPPKSVVVYEKLCPRCYLIP